MTDTPDDKEIFTAASQILAQYKGDALGARHHASRMSDELRDSGDIDGHMVWERIHRAIFDLTDTESDGGTVH